MSMRQIKCVVVGDGAVGKTSLLMCYAMGVFPDDYMPESSVDYSAQVIVDDAQIELNLWDTTGYDVYGRLRQLVYPNADVICICFSVISRTSFKNVRVQWIKEIKRNVPNMPVILVGTKVDLRDDTNNEYVTYKEGVCMAKLIKAYNYFECSAKTREGLQQVFVGAAKHVLKLDIANKSVFPCRIH